jgi:hypothetical protein
MHRSRYNTLGKITLILVLGVLLFSTVGCNKRTTASGTSKTIKKKKIKCTGCKTKTASYRTLNEFNNQHLINIA